ncbi:MAG: tetratricopeptide repeat protein [FCB group bacterium]|jgi:signal transduction histidine kinase/prefoldin subunit 5
MGLRKKYIGFLKSISAGVILIATFSLLLAATNQTEQDISNQKATTGQINTLNNLSEENFEKSPDKSIGYAITALDKSKLIGYKFGEAVALSNIGKGYFIEKKYDKALEFYESSLNIFTGINDKSDIAKINNFIGALYFKIKEYDKALTNYKNALSIYENLKDNTEISKMLTNIGTLYTQIGNLDEAINYQLRSLDYANENKDTASISRALKKIGNLYFQKGKYDEALKYYLKRQDLKESKDESKDDEIVLVNTGKIYYSLDKYKEAIEYYQKALLVVKNDKDELKTARILTAIGNVYYDWKNYQEALFYYKQSLKIAEKKDTKNGIAILLNNIGLVYKNLGDYQKALDYCLKSLNIKEEIGDESNTYYPITSIAEIYLKLGNNNQALKYLYKALNIAENEKDNKLLQEVYYLLYEVNEASGQYKKALEYHKLYTDIKDTVIQLETNKKFLEVNTKYETGKKQTENEALRKANEIQRNYFIVVAGLIFILLIVLYNRYRSKQKTNRLLNEKNTQILSQHKELENMYGQLQIKEQGLMEANATKDKFFSIIAHDLKNPLHAITLSSDVLIHKYKFMPGEQLIDLIKNINKAGNYISELLANLLQWARSQSGRIEFEPQKINLKQAVTENLDLLIVNANKKNLDISYDIEEDTALYADSNMVNTILRNLISNAIKFTDDFGMVKISTDINCNFVQISVSDTGIGISEEDLQKLFRIDVQHTTIGTSKEKGTGLGLILCKEFVDRHGGEILVDSKEGEGTTFKITLPKFID